MVVRGGAPRAARRPASESRAWLRDYFELTELHVRPDAQGRGLGEGLLRALLTGDRTVPGAAVDARVRATSHRAGPGSSTGARGFRDVLREHRFTGDSRPFAVLGRALPLDPPEGSGG